MIQTLIQFTPAYLQKKLKQGSTLQKKPNYIYNLYRKRTTEIKVSTIRTLHRQDEPPLPPQSAHHAAHHHRYCLRSALSGKNLRPDFQGGGLRLASGIQTLLTIISVDMFINADINDINEPAINNKTD